MATVLMLIAANVWLVCSPLYLRAAYGPLRPADAALAGPPPFVASAAAATTAYVAGRAPREVIAALIDIANDGPRIAADRAAPRAGTPGPEARVGPVGNVAPADGGQAGEAGPSDDGASSQAAGEAVGPALYTQSEIDHLTDVRRVIAVLFRLGLASAGAIAIALAADGRTRRRRTMAAIAGGGRLGVGVTLIIGVLIGGAWNALFTTFHELLFAAGTWQFPADSRLIQLFPDWFWQSAAGVLALLLLVEGLVLGRVARRAGPPA
ncbi:MAG: DUF1461 domain-containing protein [Ardenticatenales bacterium]